MTKPKFMDVTEICADLGISRSTWNDWRAKNRAPRVIKLPNGKLRVRRDTYEQWLANREDEAAA